MLSHLLRLFLFYLADFFDCEEIWNVAIFSEDIPVFCWISLLSILDQYRGQLGFASN